MAELGGSVPGKGEGEFLVEEVRPDGSLVVLGREPLPLTQAEILETSLARRSARLRANGEVAMARGLGRDF